MYCNYASRALKGLNTCDWFSRHQNVYSIRSTENTTSNDSFAPSWHIMSFLLISVANAGNSLPGSIKERRTYSGFKFTLMRNLLGTAVANR